MNRFFAFRASLLSLVVTGVAFASSPDKKLLAKAKITEEEAEKTALAELARQSIQNPKLKDKELEEEHDRLVWSFDFKAKGTKDEIEVQIDAITGAVVSVEHENEEAQKKEEAEDKAKGGKKD